MGKESLVLQFVYNANDRSATTPWSDRVHTPTVSQKVIFPALRLCQQRVLVGVVLLAPRADGHAKHLLEPMLDLDRLALHTLWALCRIQT